MAAAGTVLALVGLLVMFVGGIWLLVLAFQESIGWGIGGLLLSPVLLIFAIMHWDAANKPFFLWLSGFGVWIVGAVLVGMGAPPQ